MSSDTKKESNLSGCGRIFLYLMICGPIFIAIDKCSWFEVDTEDRVVGMWVDQVARKHRRYELFFAENGTFALKDYAIGRKDIPWRERGKTFTGKYDVNPPSDPDYSLKPEIELHSFSESFENGVSLTLDTHTDYMQSPHFNISKYDGTSSLENLLINEKKGDPDYENADHSLHGLVVTKQDNGYDTEALEIIEANDSSLDLGESGLKRSADGLQFTKAPGKTGQKESVGFTEDEKLVYKGRLKNDQADGEWTTFYPDGRLHGRGMKENGINNGPFTFWYPDGTVKMRGQYKEGS